jgi:hypothetical protein
MPWFEWGEASSGEINLRCAVESSRGTDGNSATLLGHKDDGKIYMLSAGTYANDSVAFATAWYPPTVRESGRNIQHKAFEVELKEGTGAGTHYLSYTDDRERNWTTANADGETGYITDVNADYDQRFVWRQLGSSRERLYQYSIIAAVERVIFGAELTAGVGTMAAQQAAIKA